MSAMKRRLSLSRHKSTAGSVPEFLKRSELWAKIASFSCEPHFLFVCPSATRD